MNGFFLFKHFSTPDKAGPPRHGRVNFIADQLAFDATQLKKFKELDKVHRNKINALRSDINTFKEALFDKVSDENFNNSEIEAITTKIADIEKAMALETFRFFNSVSKLCNKNQRERFEKIIKDGLRRPHASGGDRPPNGPDREHRPPPPPRN